MDRSHNQETHFGLVQSTGIRYFEVFELVTDFAEDYEDLKTVLDEFDDT